MTERPLVVVGGGEHARVVIEAARSQPDAWSIVGIADPDPAVKTLRSLGVDHLGDDRALASWIAGLERQQRPWLVLGFVGPAGAPGRDAAIARFDAETRWATIVHERAWVSPSAALGDGSVVLAGAVVNAGAVIGLQAIVNTHAVVEHDVVLGDQVHVGPGAVVGGGARVGSGAFIALGALIRDHVSIGAGATVAMGAVVVADVPAGSVVAGSPARPLDVAARG